MLHLKKIAQKQNRASSSAVSITATNSHVTTRNCIPDHPNAANCIDHRVLYDGRLSIPSQSVSRSTLHLRGHYLTVGTSAVREFRRDGDSPEKCNFLRATPTADPSADHRQKFNLRHHRRTRAGVRFRGDG